MRDTNDSDNKGRERAYRKLRGLLTSVGLKPGTRLGEIEWAKRLGVHRGAIREAMAVLLHEGLLTRQGRSFVVPVLQERDVEEIYQVRAVIEVAALRMSAQRTFDKEALQPLINLCQTMEHLRNSELYLGFSEADEKFHAQIVELSGNRRLTKVYASAALPHSKFGGWPPENIADVLRNAQDEHFAICQAVCEGRTLDAIQVLENHFKLDWLTSPAASESTHVGSPRHQQEKLRVGV